MELKKFLPFLSASRVGWLFLKCLFHRCQQIYQIFRNHNLIFVLSDKNYPYKINHLAWIFMNNIATWWFNRWSMICLQGSPQITTGFWGFVFLCLLVFIISILFVFCHRVVSLPSSLNIPLICSTSRVLIVSKLQR